MYVLERIPHPIPRIAAMFSGHQLMPCGVIIDCTVIRKIPNHPKNMKSFSRLHSICKLIIVDQLIRAKMLNDGKKRQAEGKWSLTAIYGAYS